MIHRLSWCRVGRLDTLLLRWPSTRGPMGSLSDGATRRVGMDPLASATTSPLSADHRVRSAYRVLSQVVKVTRLIKLLSVLAPSGPVRNTSHREGEGGLSYGWVSILTVPSPLPRRSVVSLARTAR